MSNESRAAFEAWQASRKQALEDAKKACKEIATSDTTPYADGLNTGAWKCEQAIKELIK